MQEIEFPSKDGLLITADFYKVKASKGLLVCCHRSHCNRAEYRETAPKFNQLGYDCLVIDQRSGMKVFGENNKTKDRAKAQKLPTGYLDAKPDVEAAIDYAFQLNDKKPIILVGSSYSAALALLIATETQKVKAIMVFSPGEHLKGMELALLLKPMQIPIFATSAKREIEEVKAVLKYVKPKYLSHFQPELEGFHGSKIIWESVKGHEKHWEAMEAFLESVE